MRPVGTCCGARGASVALEVFHTAGCDDDLARARHAVESQSRTLLVLGDAPRLVYRPDEAHYRRSRLPRTGPYREREPGAHEAPGRAVLDRQWFAALVAPNKQLATFDNSGHNPHLDESGRTRPASADGSPPLR